MPASSPQIITRPGKLLQQYRDRAGISRETLARLVDVSLSTIHRMEMDDAIPTKARVLFDIAYELGVPLDTLAACIRAQPRD